MEITMGMNIVNQKKIDKDELNKIMEEHALWLKDHDKGKRADLSTKDLSNMDLSGIDFSYADIQEVDLMEANLKGANLSHADLRKGLLHGVNLTNAVIDETDFTKATLMHAVLNGCKGTKAYFPFACMWGCEIKNASLKKASFLGAEVCDCDFTGSYLEDAGFVNADMDNAIFVDTNLKNADFYAAGRSYWCDFENADMTGVRVYGLDLDVEKLKGVKGLNMPIYCPEEGSFIAWKKCREGKVVKLMIPEHAERKGNTPRSCRASEAVVLEIYDKDGNPAENAVSIYDDEFVYRKGETVFPKEADREHRGGWDGIYFVLSRKDTEFYAEDDDESEEDTDS